METKLNKRLRWKHFKTSWGNCVKEPLMSKEVDLTTPAFKADLAYGGVLEVQMETLFDARVVDIFILNADSTSEKVIKMQKIYILWLVNATRIFSSFS